MKIYIIGAGGIGSYLAGHINKLLNCNQLDDCNFTFFDDDVVETKNILYQNFEPSDVEDKKIEALMFKYPMIQGYKDMRVIEVNTLSNLDLLVLCADNNKIRKLAYEAYNKLGTKFIDARSNGKTCGLFSSDTDNYMNTISDDDSAQSCQYPYQLAKKEIEFGNVIIAAITAQSILEFKRSGKLPNDFIHSF